ncbi:M20/M25/M40 family metallo-hydrolase [Undibacterium fentianense]|uniref:M20/M25/M40 family metallo-hydrolase n=1 Tax=Undibacterium fentianense TaxID=2828728 RepID=A0A941E235_9BURK|nr:M20/M25/M40 family metallo-hydrolase [Undibacterium fentianense]MBR7800965.1 M20/M25/M40 family metallo-hydrolase [Undibacterium fentianense]
MQNKILSSLMLGLVLSASANVTSIAAEKKVWITVGDAAFNELKQISNKYTVKQSQVINSGSTGFARTEKVHLLQIDESVIHSLSDVIHQKLKRCGGFIYHYDEPSGRAALSNLSRGIAPAVAGLAPSYTIDNQATVTPLLSQMQASNIGQTIVDLSAFVNRYYTTSGGVSGSNWIKNKWTDLAAGRSNVTVEQFTHAAFPQKSVILTIQGTDNASEVVVLGGHQDSINTAGTTETTKAPGADDDASGIASLTEAIRVMLASNYQPRRTIKFIAYAAEEVGLKGSAEIAKKYKTDGVKVVGVMQLDMTNYKGSAKDIYLYTDYTNAAQNTFVANLISTYQPTLTVGNDSCGYGCSDHASWHAQGYPTSMPFETTMSESNPKIHGTGDTYANMGSQANHALKFGRLAASFAVELGSDGPATTPSTTALSKDVAVAVNGGAGAQANYSFVVPTGASNLTFKTTGGTGDLDIYTQLGSLPTTTSYLQKADGATNTETITIASPTAGTYYLLANSATAVSGASLVASYQTGVPSNVLTSGVAVSVGTLSTNTTKLYTIVIPSGKTSLTFKMTGGTGDGDIYAKLGSAPTTTVYDKKSDGSTNTETITYTTPAAGTYYLLIKAYSAVNGASLVATVQ